MTKQSITALDLAGLILAAETIAGSSNTEVSTREAIASAAIEACQTAGVSENFETIIYLLLFATWNDARWWAERQVKGRGEVNGTRGLAEVERGDTK